MSKIAELEASMARGDKVELKSDGTTVIETRKTQGQVFNSGNEVAGIVAIPQSQTLGLCAPAVWPIGPVQLVPAPLAMDGFQRWVAHRWGQRPKDVDLAVMTLGVMGEIAEVLQECVDLTIAGGRVSEHIKKEIRGSKAVDTSKLTLELGDVLHYLTVIASHYHVSMTDVMAANVDKLVAREAKSTATTVEPYGIGAYKT